MNSDNNVMQPKVDNHKPHQREVYNVLSCTVVFRLTRVYAVIHVGSNSLDRESDWFVPELETFGDWSCIKLISQETLPVCGIDISTV